MKGIYPKWVDWVELEEIYGLMHFWRKTGKMKWDIAHKATKYILFMCQSHACCGLLNKYGNGWPSFTIIGVRYQTIHVLSPTDMSFYDS